MRARDNLRDRAAIVGIGATEFSKNSGRSELQLGLEAIRDALDDAGIAPSGVDGLCTFDIDSCAETELVRNLGGGDLRFYGRVHFGGGGGGGLVLQAAMAVATGAANVVVCYRALNERSERRFGEPNGSWLEAQPTPERMLWDFHFIHGIQTPAAYVALAMRRYMHETGATSEDFGRMAVAIRKHAATNPKAFFYGKPITLEDHQASRMIADPLHLLDCCQESDGAVAFVVTSVERARDLRQTPALIRAAAQGIGPGTQPLITFYRPDIAPRDEMRVVADRIWPMSGITPNDINVAILYDHFAPTLLPALEAYGFCKWGEAKDFIKDGAIELGGRLPINTNGGQLGEAYIHGMNGFAEAVRQIRGTAVNQVEGAEHVLVAAGNGTPTSAVILGRA